MNAIKLYKDLANFTHDLTKLAKLSGISFSEEYLGFTEKLNPIL